MKLGYIFSAAFMFIMGILNILIGAYNPWPWNLLSLGVGAMVFWSLGFWIGVHRALYRMEQDLEKNKG